MTRDELEHAIRAACDVVDDSELIVFGSQAILGSFSDAPPELRISAEADIMPKNHPERSEVVDGALGELSMFHRTYGFYVHGLSISAAKLPNGWAMRTVPVKNANTRGNTGWCLEAHDLAASKLAAFRERDRAFVRIMLRDRLIKVRELLSRVDALPADTATKNRMIAWIQATKRDLNRPR